MAIAAADDSSERVGANNSSLKARSPGKAGEAGSRDLDVAAGTYVNPAETGYIRHYSLLILLL